jgi:hypothetical protein
VGTLGLGDKTYDLPEPKPDAHLIVGVDGRLLVSAHMLAQATPVLASEPSRRVPKGRGVSPLPARVDLRVADQKRSAFSAISLGVRPRRSRFYFCAGR